MAPKNVDHEQSEVSAAVEGLPEVDHGEQVRRSEKSIMLDISQHEAIFFEKIKIREFSDNM